MNVTCPRCGACQELQSESRFYSCSYCRSTFAVAGGGRVSEYLADIHPDERSAWSVLADYLEQGGLRSAVRRGHCDTLICPFWLVRSDQGSTIFRPATTMEVPLLASISLPGCDLVPLDDSAPRVLPDLPLEGVLESAGLSAGKCRVSLVHLPLQVLEYSVDGIGYRCTVVVADWKVYADSLPSPVQSGIPASRVCFLAGYGTLLLVLSVAIRQHLIRGVLFLLLLGAAWFVARRMVARELSS